MERYIPEFIARDVDGEQLLQMNGSRLKVRMKVLQGFLSATGHNVLTPFHPSAGSGRALFI